MLLQVKYYEWSLYDEYKAILTKRGFEHIGTGSFRSAYRRRNTVVKIPYNSYGFEDNITEAWAYHTYRKGPSEQGYVYAPCRLLPNACLMMVYVEPYWGNDMPHWTRWIDGAQCGWFHGRAVAYDSGVDIVGDMRNRAFQWAGIT